ncbi:MAG: YccF domain-containing protein [Caldilineaceae bacterium]
MFGGLVMCLTIVGIPFGLQSIKLGFATFTPFGKEVVETNNPDSLLKMVFNFAVDHLLFGWKLPWRM